jgi:DNA-binding NarL/FixJ family response regulator
MNVLMVDDHVMFLQGMKSLLNVLAPELDVETTSDVGHAAELAKLTEFDLVLLDSQLGDCDAAGAIRWLRNAGCMARVVILSAETHPALLRQSIELGAVGFIPKKYSSEMMVAALRLVLAGRVFLPSETYPARSSGHAVAGATGHDAYAPHAPLDPRLAGLTTRQMAVYRAATRGLSNKLIARQLDISESTVKAHLSAVYSALGVRNRTEAAYQASREGMQTG